MNGSESASQVSELARTVEKVSFTPADKLEFMLNGLVRSGNPLIATWATSVFDLGFRSPEFSSLSELAPTVPLRDPVATRALLRQLFADPGRSNRQRLVADDVLGWYDPDWKTSPQRFSALLPLCASRLDSWSFKNLNGKLYPIHWPRDNSRETEQLRLIQVFMANPTVPAEYKKQTFVSGPAHLDSPAALKFWCETMPLHWLYESAPEMAWRIADSPPTTPAGIAGINHIVTQWEVGAAMTNSETRRKALTKAIESVKAVLATKGKGKAI